MTPEWNPRSQDPGGVIWGQTSYTLFPCLRARYAEQTAALLDNHRAGKRSTCAMIQAGQAAADNLHRRPSRFPLMYANVILLVHF